MNYKKITGSLLLLTLFTMAPVTFADAAEKHGFWANDSASAFISADGLVRVFGATVTSVSGGVITATTQFGGAVLNWIVNVNSDTKIFADGSRTATTSAITVGEKVAFKGVVTATSSAATTISAKKLVDESWKSLKKVVGEVTAVNSANGTYTVDTRGDTDITVQTNADTEWKVGTTTGTFGSVEVGSIIHAIGTLGADASVLTANTVLLRVEPAMKNLRDLRENWEEWKEARREARGESDENHRGLKLGLKHFLDVGLGE